MSLPDGTSVSVQSANGWNVNPPAFSVQSSNDWNISPPPIQSITATATADEEITVGETVTVSGKLTDSNDYPVKGEPVELVFLDPSGDESRQSETTDSNGEYSHTKTLSETGDWTVYAEASGWEVKSSTGWNQ